MINFLVKIIYLIEITVFFVFIIAGPVSAENTWHLIEEKNSIKLYERSIEGLDFKEFKAETVIPAKLETIIAVLLDVEGSSQWLGNIEETRLLKREDKISFVYLSIDLPWPLSNRDIVLKGSQNFDEETHRLIIWSEAIKSPLVPLRNGYIRMTDAKSRWVLTVFPDNSNSTHVLYRTLPNPEGYIPAFLVNLVMKDQMYNTITGLISMTQQPAYINAAEQIDCRLYINKNFTDNYSK